MGKKALSERDKDWQRKAGTKAVQAERNLYIAFSEAFEGTNYKISKHPKDLKHLYDDVVLSPDVLAQIFCPDEATMKKSKRRGWGVSPDFSITNTVTGKILFGEIKRQDGWIEGKKPNDGRGNVHERMCKLFTPGLIKAYRRISGITSPDILPFWVVLEGDITRDPKRNREIAFWFDKYDKNYFMWRPNMSDADLIEHFDRYLRPYLD